MEKINPEIRRKIMRSIKSHSLKERKFLFFLKNNNLEIRNDYKIGRYVFDFLIEDCILVEYRGCFWHFHEHIKMPKGGILGKRFWYEKLKINRKKDKIKEKLAILNGFPLLIIWECGKVEIIMGLLKQNKLSI